MRAPYLALLMVVGTQPALAFDYSSVDRWEFSLLKNDLRSDEADSVLSGSGIRGDYQSFVDERSYVGYWDFGLSMSRLHPDSGSALDTNTLTMNGEYRWLTQPDWWIENSTVNFGGGLEYGQFKTKQSLGTYESRVVQLYGLAGVGYELWSGARVDVAYKAGLYGKAFEHANSSLSITKGSNSALGMTGCPIGRFEWYFSRDYAFGLGVNCFTNGAAKSSFLSGASLSGQETRQYFASVVINF